MTIDERLDKLVERHEALAQTVEYLALQSVEHDKHLRIQGEHIDRILSVVEKDGEHIDRIFSVVEKNGEHIDRILSVVEKDGEHIRALARIAEIHEHRISGLESDEGR